MDGPEDEISLLGAQINTAKGFFTLFSPPLLRNVAPGICF